MKDLTLISGKQWDVLLDVYLDVQRDNAKHYAVQLTRLQNAAVPFKLALAVFAFAKLESTLYLHQYIRLQGYGVAVDSYFEE